MDDADLLFSLADQLLQAGHVSAAETLCQGWLAQTPNCWQAWRAQGKVAAAKNDNRAEQFLTQALGLADPTYHGPIQNDLGCWFRSQGNTSAATITWFNAAVSELNAQRPDQALEWLRVAREAAPADGPTLSLLAQNLQFAAAGHQGFSEWLMAEAERFDRSLASSD